MLKIGLVGLGSISGVHLKAIKSIPNAQLVAVCDIDEKKRDVVPEINFYIDIKEMLEKEKLDCLHICLPHYCHVPVALLAAKYQVNVFMEKPVGLNEKDTLPLKEIENQIKIGICFQNRYNKTVTVLKEILDSQKYGAVKGCKAIVTWNRSPEYYSDYPWRGRISEAGGGVMLNQAIHTLDLMYILMGSVKWIKANVGNLLLEDIEVEDTVCSHMEFENGTHGIFYATVTYCDNSSVEFEVVCEEAILKIKNSKLTLYQNSKEIELSKDGDVTCGKTYYGDSHTTAIDRFYNAILENSEDYIHIEDATYSIRMIDATKKSSKTGKRIYLAKEII